MPAVIGQERARVAYLNTRHPLGTGHVDSDIWILNSARIANYARMWRFYLGLHWDPQPNPEEPVVTANFIRRFIDKHNEYLFGKGFTVHTNFRGTRNDAAEQALQEEWEKNGDVLPLEMGQVGGITGDCWVTVGLDEDPIFGDRIKLTVIPSEFCFPIFKHSHDREMDALLILWPDVEVIDNSQFTKLRTRTVRRGEYWTKQRVYKLEDGEQVSEQTNLLGVIPAVHIGNLPLSGHFFGAPDISEIVDLNQNFNEKMTNISDIINYHASPITLVYGAKVKEIERGPNKIWSNLPTEGKVENLKLEGELDASNTFKSDLKDAIFELGSMSKAAFGGAEAVSNTSGVSLAIQFAPIIEHMRTRQKTYGEGIRRINYLILRYKELLGQYSATGANPYYSGTKWPDPLPRDKSARLEDLLNMLRSQLIGRVQLLKELIHNDIAPSDLEIHDADKIVEEAIAEDQEIQKKKAEIGAMEKAKAGIPAKTGSTGAAEKSSRSAERKAGKQGAR